MDCKCCTHDNVCKYKANFITYKNMLSRDCSDNTLHIECNFYDEIQVFKEEPYEIDTEYKIVFNNGMTIYNVRSLEDLAEECKKQLRKGNSSYYCYEKILCSNGEVKIKKLPF